MALENYLLDQIVREAVPLVTNQLVGRIYEPSAMEFLVNLRRSDNLSLYFSLLPNRPAFFLTYKLKNLATEHSASHLTNFMRKYFTGATLTELVKEADERRIKINFSNFDITGKPISLTLLLDLMGRGANAHLFVDNAYLASLREVPEHINISLTPLEKTLLPTKELTEDKFNELLKTTPLSELANKLSGFSPTLVKEFIFRATSQPAFQALKSILKELSEPKEARIYALESLSKLPIGKVDIRNNLILTYLDLAIAKDLVPTKFLSLNEATENYFNLLTKLTVFQNRFNGLKAKAKSAITKLESLIKKLHDEEKEFSQADKHKRLGELILANLATLHQESNRIFLIDYFDPEQKEISLVTTENKSPKQLAEDYFKQYQRAKRGQQAVAKRLAETERELVKQKKLLSNILLAETELDLDNIEKPVDSKVTKRPDVKKQSSLPSGLRCYLSSDGYEILVGRNDKGNDQLTFQLAKPLDIWLHTADYPGSHVLIRNPQRNSIPSRTIFEAAALAAFFSKAKEENLAAVRYTEKKNVTRPKKSKAGMALLTDFKTIMVKPQEAGQRLLE